MHCPYKEQLLHYAEGGSRIMAIVAALLSLQSEALVGSTTFQFGFRPRDRIDKGLQCVSHDIGSIANKLVCKSQSGT